MKKFILFIILFCFGVGFWYVRGEIYTEVSQETSSLSFSVESGESVVALANRLSEEQIVRSSFFFRKYVVWKGVDTNIQSGIYTVSAPVTLARVVDSLATPSSKKESSITVLPGWGLKQLAEYFVEEGIAVSVDEVYKFTGEPAVDYRQRTNSFGGLPNDLDVLHDKYVYVGYEGYFAPETFRIFSDASVEEVLLKLLKHRDGQFTKEMYIDIEKSGRNIHEVMTIASLLEREVRTETDRKKVADLFWRRYDVNWALQADSSVHYIAGTDGSVFTDSSDRAIDSLWNTYKYPGLPLGPISMPSIDSIMAAIYPEKNDYWYFLTTLDTGEVKYGGSLDEHNLNVARYLR